MEQRHEAVLEVLGGLSATGVAHRYGVTRETVRHWLRRYANPVFLQAHRPLLLSGHSASLS